MTDPRAPAVSLSDAPLATIFGASGFVGRATVIAFARAQWRVRAVVRDASGFEMDQHGVEIVSTPAPVSDAPACVSGASVVVNCVGRAHVTNRESEINAQQRFDFANRYLPFALAAAARASDVPRFVHVSSVAAITSKTAGAQIVDDRVRPDPASIYGKSKLAGDEAILGLSNNRFKPIVLRPPALYGWCAPGWFPILVRAARAGLPLPVGAVSNRRSFMFVENLADAVVSAANLDLTGAFIVTDTPPIATKEFYRQLLDVYGHGDRCWAIAPPLVKVGLRSLLGGRADSLLGDAAFDGAAFREASGWDPPHSMKTGVARMTGVDR